MKRDHIFSLALNKAGFSGKDEQVLVQSRKHLQSRSKHGDKCIKLIRIKSNLARYN